MKYELQGEGRLSKQQGKLKREYLLALSHLRLTFLARVTCCSSEWLGPMIQISDGVQGSRAWESETLDIDDERNKYFSPIQHLTLQMEITEDLRSTVTEWQTWAWKLCRDLLYQDPPWQWLQMALPQGWGAALTCILAVGMRRKDTSQPGVTGLWCLCSSKYLVESMLQLNFLRLPETFWGKSGLPVINY